MKDELTRNKVEYIVMFITEFSKKHHLQEQEAYGYLKRYDVIDVIDKYYDAMHTQSFSDMVTDMTEYCQRKGGTLV